MKLKKDILNQITERILEELQLIAFDRSGEVSHAQKLSAIRLLGKYIGLDSRCKQDKSGKKPPPPVIIVDDLGDLGDEFADFIGFDNSVGDGFGSLEQTPTVPSGSHGRADPAPTFPATDEIFLNREQRRALEKLQREEKRRQKQKADSFGEPVLV